MRSSFVLIQSCFFSFARILTLFGLVFFCDLASIMNIGFEICIALRETDYTPFFLNNTQTTLLVLRKER